MNEVLSPARARITLAWGDSQGLAVGETIGSAGYALPSIDGAQWNAVGDPSDDNWIITNGGDTPIPFSMKFGGKHNVVVLGRGSILHGQIGMQTDEATIIIGENTGHGSTGNINIFGNSRGGVLFIGARTTSNQSTFFLLGDSARLIVGEDCMFSHGIVARTNDDHSMIDVITGEHLNPTGDIHIAPHVWVCPETTIVRGIKIGFGSVIGLKSIVNRDVPAFTLAAGQPARVLRENVSWDRPAIPHPDMHIHLKNWASCISD